MKIICDTTVWYEIGQSEKLQEIISDMHLVCTYGTINELAYSQKRLSEAEKHRKAIQAIPKYTREYYNHTPFEHFLSIDDCNHIPQPPKNLNNEIEILEYFAEGLPLDEEGEMSFKQDSVYSLKNKIKLTDTVNALLLQIQAANRKSKKGHLAENTTETDHAWFLSIISSYLKRNYSLKQIDTWDQLSFFCGMLTFQFKRLAVSERMKIKPNDWYDMLMMIYVQPGEQFWTYDSRWLKLIDWLKLHNIDNCLSDYLFQPE